MKISSYIILVTLLITTSACIRLGESIVPSQYFVLESLTDSAKTYSTDSLIIAIEISEFPEYLKRPQVVVQARENIIHFSDTKRWATPLEGQVLSLLTSNFELLLPQATLRISPWQSNRHADYNVQLSVKKFSGIPGQQADIDIRWHLADKTGKKRSGQYVDQRPINDSYEDLVRALNRGLDGLSEKLALEIAKPGV